MNRESATQDHSSGDLIVFFRDLIGLLNQKNNWLVVVSTPLKNMSSSVGMMKFPIYRNIYIYICMYIYIYIWKNNPNVPKHQPDKYGTNHMMGHGWTSCNTTGWFLGFSAAAAHFDFNPNFCCA